MDHTSFSDRHCHGPASFRRFLCLQGDQNNISLPRSHHCFRSQSLSQVWQQGLFAATPNSSTGNKTTGNELLGGQRWQAVWDHCSFWAISLLQMPVIWYFFWPENSNGNTEQKAFYPLLLNVFFPEKPKRSCWVFWAAEDCRLVFHLERQTSKTAGGSCLCGWAVELRQKSLLPAPSLNIMKGKGKASSKTL